MPDLLRRSPCRDHRDLRRTSEAALRLPRARVVLLSVPPSSYIAAVERYLTGAGIAKSSAWVYRISLTAWGWMFAVEPAPTGPARRGAKPPVFRFAAIDAPAPPEAPAGLAAARADEMGADTVNRELSIARKAIGWWQRQGWITGDPTIGIGRRRALPLPLREQGRPPRQPSPLPSLRSPSRISCGVCVTKHRRSVERSGSPA
ncbi:hypothetical protein ABZ079_20970 [Streptomyces sp. NPDC006314]|uniref:hypothetical protein n=1 Tax=Streptomyces sp. NPDC006314 TaxID=3154475 RepID=UPI00339E9DB0